MTTGNTHYNRTTFSGWVRVSFFDGRTNKHYGEFQPDLATAVRECADDGVELRVRPGDCYVIESFDRWSVEG